MLASCELSCIPGQTRTRYLFLIHLLRGPTVRFITNKPHRSPLKRSNTGTSLVFNCDSTGNLNRAASVDSNYCTENRCASYFLSSNESPYGTLCSLIRLHIKITNEQHSNPNQVLHNVRTTYDSTRIQIHVDVNSSTRIRIKS